MDRDLGQTFDALLSEQAASFDLPGLAWHIQHGQKSRQGCHVREGDPAISPQQNWHWGSCTKALTATLLAAYVDQGVLPKGWNSTVEDLLPELKGTPVAPLNIKQILLHRSGLITDLDEEEEKALATSVSSLPLTEQRLAFARKLSEKPLAAPPDSRFQYSNAGYAFLSVLLESHQKKSFEEQITQHIAIPLKMTTLSFGVPSGIPIYDEEGETQPDYKDHPWNHSAFSANSSLEDWGKFVFLQFQTLKLFSLDKDSKTNPMEILKIGPSARTLHTPASPAFPGEAYFGSLGPNGYAMGWTCHWDDSVEPPFTLEPTRTLFHFGTNFVFNAGCLISLDHDLVVVLGSNCGSMMARLAMRMGLEGILDVIKPK